MGRHVIIDGNNVLYAMHEHAPMPAVGRETLVRVIEKWAQNHTDKVTLVFDGSVPQGGMARQMDSTRIIVKFSAPLSADDVIVKAIHKTGKPAAIRIISSDTAILKEASYRKCRWTDSASFVGEIFAKGEERPTAPEAPPPEKPQHVSEEESEEWLRTFDLDEEDEDRETGIT
jgi:predicted RNA-binding protein with PIN domain